MWTLFLLLGNCSTKTSQSSKQGVFSEYFYFIILIAWAVGKQEVFFYSFVFLLLLFLYTMVVELVVDQINCYETVRIIFLAQKIRKLRGNTETKRIFLYYFFPAIHFRMLFLFIWRRVGRKFGSRLLIYLQQIKSYNIKKLDVFKYTGCFSSRQINFEG